MKKTKQTRLATHASPPFLTNASNHAPAHDEIAHYAYSLWEQRGHPAGQDVDIWLQAEAQLRQQLSAPDVQA